MATRSLKNVSTSDLQRELDARRKRLASMVKEREQLATRLEELDSEIAVLNGKPKTRKPKSRSRTTKRRASRSRPKNAKPLVEVLHKTLRNPMSVTEAAAAVKKAGYKSRAKDFRAVVNLTLIQNPKLFKRVERGVYKAA